MMAVVEVVVNIKNKAVDRIFDYEVPFEFEALVQPGSRVMVPFGPRSLTGFVLRKKETTEFNGKLRPIQQVIDVIPVLNAELLPLGIKLSKETGATMIACFDAMIPAAMKTKCRKMFVPVENKPLSDGLMDLFREKKAIDAAVVPINLLEEIKQALEAGHIDIIYEASAKLGKKTRRYVSLIDPDVDVDLLKRSKGQMAVVTALKEAKKPIAKDQMNASPAVLKALIDKDIIAFVDVEVYRDPYASEDFQPYKKLPLNEGQQLAVRTINEMSEGVALLHGVTGSGKTEVYLEAIEKVIEKQQQVLVLIPEITLTTQITSRFKSRFKEDVAVLHSGLSVGEKYDEWRKVLRGEVNIVIGARSAVFAPLTNIGLIIIDEEHEATFKQEEMPRYHAIEVAKHRASYHQCPVILGSATPSLESYARAQKGVYTLIELPQRAATNASLPDVRLIDMNKQILGTGSGIMSAQLEAAIEARLEKGEQVILLLNRRGYANFMQCRDCHDVINCPNCDVTLTYHKQTAGLKCHYCNFTTPVVTICPACDSSEVRFFGTGTQKVEEFLEKRYANAKILRMDVDSTSKKGDHKRLIKSFEQKEADILIGTQMVAKGLDFPNVTLVGVLDGDLMLHFPDFKASERTFQILTQVAGRAGRHKLGGEVYIETYSPNHYVMQHVKNQNYHAFYEEEMNMRRLFKYSPYFFHAKVLLTSTEPDELMIISEQVGSYLRQQLKRECLIIGPTMPSVARVNQRFRMHFILKYKKAPHLANVLTHLLAHIDQKEVSLAVDYFPMYLT